MAKPNLGEIKYYGRDNLPLGEVSADLTDASLVSVVFDLDYVADGSAFGGIAFEFTPNSNNGSGFWMSPRSEYGPGNGELLFRCGTGYVIAHYPMPSPGTHRYVWIMDLSVSTPSHRLWIDGVEITATTIRADARNAGSFGSDIIYVGARSGRIVPLDGGVTLPQAFPRALSAPEIAAYNTEVVAATDGYRITESGNRRVTGFGESRITERLVTAEVYLTAFGGITALGARVANGNSNLSGFGALSSAALKSSNGSVSLTAAGALNASALSSKSGAAALSASAQMQAQGFRFTNGAGQYTAAGSTTSTGVLGLQGQASLASVGSSLSVAMRLVYGMAALEGRGSILADGAVGNPGTASLSAAGLISAVGLREAIGSGQLLGQASLSASAKFNAAGRANLSSSGSATSASAVTRVVGADLFGSGAINVDGRISRPARSSSTGSSMLISGGALIYNVAASLTGQGSLSAKGGALLNGASNLGFTPISRITQAGDRRITQGGDVRSVLTYTTSAMTADSTLRKFAGEIRAKRADAYYGIVPYAKVEGAYIEVPLVYIKTNNAYMRAR
jgi:hypothetical protein